MNRKPYILLVPLVTLVALFGIAAFEDTIGVRVTTGGVLQSPTNFFTVNASNNWYALTNAGYGQSSASGLSNNVVAAHVFKPRSVVTLSLGGTGGTNVIGHDLSTNNAFVLYATTNAYFSAPANLTPGQEFKVWVYQDATGRRELTFDGAVWKPSGLIYQAATTNANAVDLLACVVGPHGTNIHFSYSLRHL